MGTRKIKYHEARNIGREIAKKAFAHLTAPLEARLAVLAKEAYDRVWENLGVSKAVILKHGFGEERFSAQITVYNNHGAEHEVWHRLSNNDEDDADAKFLPKLVVPSGYNPECKVQDDDLFARIDDVWCLLKPLHEKRDALEHELYAQVEGKTSTQAMKNWPEAADIIARTLNLGSPAMTVPLEQLLARFLPALPAPKED